MTTRERTFVFSDRERPELAERFGLALLCAICHETRRSARRAKAEDLFQTFYFKIDSYILISGPDQSAGTFNIMPFVFVTASVKFLRR